MRGKSGAATIERVPCLGPGVDPAALPLTPIEGYLLSRVDGRTSWRVLREIGGAAPDEVDRCLERWLSEGVLVLGEAVAPPAPRPLPARAPGASGLPDVDPSLEMPVELQRRLLRLAARLDAPYHEILGVAPDAERKALKKAYFQLSKEFHPDRYFRKELGLLAPHLERVFKKIVEAYELLSDPTARAEIERSLASGRRSAGSGARGREAGAREGGAPAPLRSGRPHVFSITSRMAKDRRARAKGLFESGMAAFAAGRWIEAAGAVRLAIAFDPWNAIYREQFAEVQRCAYDERARQLVKEAESALELRDYPAALRAFEEALHYRPRDADLLRRAARLGWAAGSDLHQAKEWAMEAVELDPRDGGAHRLLGQIYRAAGLAANARRELETALQLDPGDEEARAEMRALGGGPLQALRWLGGKR